MPKLPIHFTQVDVDEAIAQRRGELQELKKALAGTLDETLHDDVFLVRYLLSYKKASKCVEPIKLSIQYRKENASWLASAAKEDFRPEDAPHFAKLTQWLAGAEHGTTLHGGPVQIIRAGLTDLPKLMNHASVEEVGDFMLWGKEAAYHECDRVTRKTRKLTKMLVVMDMAGSSMWSGQDKRFFTAISNSSKLSENLHPQLVLCQAVLNPPSFMSVMWKVARLFMSKRTLEKFKICTGGNTAKGDIATCPFVKNLIKRETLPTFSGGSCNCKGGCIPGSPNDSLEKRCPGTVVE